MGTFRDRMDEDLQIRGFSPNTRSSYLLYMKDFVRFHKTPPNRLGPEHIRAYQLHLTKERKVAYGTFNIAVCSLRFFYSITCPRDWDVQQIPYQKTGRRLPVILSRKEARDLIIAPSNLKHRAMLSTLYATGLRVSEMLNLRPDDIDSGRMQVHVWHGKGNKDRSVMLSERLLWELRTYWKVFRPTPWLFPGSILDQPLDRSSVAQVIKKAAQATNLTKSVSPHSLRHAFATHLLESGVNIRVIQKLLGHKSLSSTQIYTHVANTELARTKSPFDLLPAPGATTSDEEN